MTYNSLDLVGKNSNNGANFVNYSYLSDGTKLSALTAVPGLQHRLHRLRRKTVQPIPPSLDDTGSSLREVLWHLAICLLQQ